MERLALALMVASRKLRHYFQSHTIRVLTNHPLRQALQKPETSGRLLKWSVELSQFDIKYVPRTAIKGQALVDFLAEFSHRPVPATSGEVEVTKWKLYVDGASSENGSGAGVLLNSPEGHKITSAVRFKFKASNNEVEYEALIAELRLASHLKIEMLSVFSDSQLVVTQVKEEYQARGEKMGAYLRKVKEELVKFKNYEILQIPRTENANVDALAKLASSRESDTLGVVPIEELEQPTIEEKVKALIVQRCLDDAEAQKVLHEIHEGVYGNHTGEQSLALKVLRQGYYWPTLKKDAFQYARRCDKCQRYVTIPRAPLENLTSIISPWPFAKWRVDLIGPLHLAPGGFKFTIIAVDYYTKWAEVKALTTTTKAACTKFMWDHIVCRFGVPHSIVSDNEKQFNNASTRRFCDSLGIRKDFSTPIHPQSNGQVEAVNKILKYTLKKRLDELKGKWAEELPKVLWAYRTTSRTTTGETPFSMAYGVEAVLPVEIKMPTLRTVVHNDDDNAKGMNGELDLLEEKRLDSQLHLAAYRQRMT
ncbi:uncharacterized protein K02A2.6-like [Morus notabilis]|uniref:uncharacterized protein K02A2.6-like n=1 Tax=Morus notabilis TaxID=981085 RepID=UPI000CED2974|nr:uncharacterized protein K02A2.6-like [Morus notabilis]